VGGDAVEGEAGGDDGECATVLHAVGVGGMPVKDDVNVFEEAGADHIDLAGAAFFGGSAVVTESAGNVILLHVILDGDGCEGWREAFHAGILGAKKSNHKQSAKRIER